MLQNANWRPFPRYVPEPEVVDEPDVSPSQHDLIVRYALIGIFVIMAMTVLQQTKVITMPVVAGVIFGLVLGPLVDWLVRHRVPQGLAATLVTLLFVMIIISAIGALAVPVAAWSDQLPAMGQALRAKVAGLFATLDELKAVVAGLMGQPATPFRLSTETEGAPLATIAMSSTSIAAEFLIFLATIFFWLATRRHLKAQILRLCLGRGARRSAGAFFEEIEVRVARYFTLLTLINLGVGALTAIIAFAAGLPFPLFWGALAFLLNYLAFIGPIVMTALLFAGALIDAPTALAAAVPAAAYFVVHLVEGNIVNPIVVGRRLTVPPFMVFMGFVFWLWLWGPVGAILSTPILIVALVAREEFAKYRKAQREEQVQRDAPQPERVASAVAA